jgi:hypothetical protein
MNYEETVKYLGGVNKAVYGIDPFAKMEFEPAVEPKEDEPNEEWEAKNLEQVERDEEDKVTNE